MSDQLTDLITVALENIDYMQANMSGNPLVSPYADYLAVWEQDLRDLHTQLENGDALDFTMTDNAVVALGNLAMLQSALNIAYPLPAIHLPGDLLLEDVLSAVYLTWMLWMSRQDVISERVSTMVNSRI